VVGAGEGGEALQAARVRGGGRGEVRGEDGGAVGDGRAGVQVVLVWWLGGGTRRGRHVGWMVLEVNGQGEEFCRLGEVGLSARSVMEMVLDGPNY
jgi:hypothetical protein